MADATLLNKLDRVTRIDVGCKTADGKQIVIGMIQEVSPSESREVTSHYTLGGDKPEIPKVLVPGLVNRRTLAIKNLALFGNTIVQQFQGTTVDNFVYSLSQQTQPFDILVTKKQASTGLSYTLTYENCLLSDFSYTQDISRGGEVVIVENCTAVFTDVTASKPA
jgi:hypothetical protein